MLYYSKVLSSASSTLQGENTSEDTDDDNQDKYDKLFLLTIRLSTETVPNISRMVASSDVGWHARCQCVVVCGGGRQCQGVKPSLYQQPVISKVRDTTKQEKCRDHLLL